MTLGLPSHLEPRIVGHAFNRAQHAIALVCIISTFFLTVTRLNAQPGLLLWPALVALMPMIAVIYWADRRTSAFWSVTYLVIGGASIYWFSATQYAQPAASNPSEMIPVTLPAIALLLVGGPWRSELVQFLWCIAGYVVAEVSIGAAMIVTGHPLEFHLDTLLALVILLSSYLVSSFSRRTSRRTQPMLHRAARDEQLAAMRYRIEVKAAALMHDTVLSHLAAIADSVEPQLKLALRQQITTDLAILVGEEWLTEDAPELDLRSTPDWQNSELFTVIEDARRDGLQVESSGDLGAIGRVSPPSATALALAVTQCLVNVQKHSGVNRVEIAVFGSDFEVSVMVIDGGRGFSEADTSSDRLGLRHSVRGRMEAVGAHVQVWSTPGRGTSVMIRMPASAQHSGPTATGAAS